jgi:hypothetical protein
MWTRTLAALCLFTAGPAAAETPLSAIDWLSRSVEAEGPDALPGEVSVRRLGAPPRAVGHIPPGSVGLTPGMWEGSNSEDLVLLLGRMPADLPLPLRDALATLVSVEAAAEDPQNAFLLARIDALLALGRIDAARLLVREAGGEDPALFRRAFDISLLTGQEDAECRRLRSYPGIAPTYPARIFCLARLGDWQAAALTLESAQALDVLTADEVAILARFLHDGEEDMLPPPERPETVTPLVFRLYEAIGAPLSTRTLPLAFAHADLRHQNGWKTRLEAAERLYRAGSIPAETLLVLYLEREPAASGGVWDRVAAVQTWQAASPSNDAAADAAAAALAPAGIERLAGRRSGSPTAPVDGDAEPDGDIAAMIDDGRTGEAALTAVVRAAAAWEGDPDDLSRALAALNAVGLDVETAGEPPQWAANQ